MFGRVEDEIACLAQNVNRNSSPSKLRITDLRIAELRNAPMSVPLIRIDTNQGISGYGEVRDGGSKTTSNFVFFSSGIFGPSSFVSSNVAPSSAAIMIIHLLMLQ